MVDPPRVRAAGCSTSGCLDGGRRPIRRRSRQHRGNAHGVDQPSSGAGFYESADGGKTGFGYAAAAHNDASRRPGLRSSGIHMSSHFCFRHALLECRYALTKMLRQSVSATGEGESNTMKTSQNATDKASSRRPGRWRLTTLSAVVISTAGMLFAGDLFVQPDKLDVREGPGLLFDPVESISKNAKLQELERTDDGWIKVQTPSGKQGYVFKGSVSDKQAAGPGPLA